RSHRTCHNKCIASRYAEPDLSKGESTCLDRCVAKFLGVHKAVEERVQAQGAAPGAMSSPPSA
ncbi:mitochondrial import inner membrane translocase subunit Tim10, partial [Hysterangium stoloniferum]